MILFIDDDKDRMRSYADYMILEGYEAEVIGTDSEALEFIETNKGDITLICLDMMMPSELYSREETDDRKHTGRRLFTDIRAITDKIPVIIFSIIKDEELSYEMIEMGARDYLIKTQTPPSILLGAIQEMGIKK